MTDIKNLVTYNTAIELKALGFDQYSTHYCIEKLEENKPKGRKFNCLMSSYPTDWNHVDSKSKFTDDIIYLYVSVPTLYEAIRWVSEEIEKRIIHISAQRRTTFNNLKETSIFAEPSYIKIVLKKLIKILISGRKSIESKKTNQSYDKRK